MSRGSEAAAGVRGPSGAAARGRGRRHPRRPGRAGNPKPLRVVSPRAGNFFPFLCLGRLSRVCTMVLFRCVSGMFRRGVLSPSGGHGVVCGGEGTLSPITPKATGPFAA